ncbi:MAG: signal peptidase II [bacterium]
MTRENQFKIGENPPGQAHFARAGEVADPTEQVSAQPEPDFEAAEAEASCGELVEMETESGLPADEGEELSQALRNKKDLVGAFFAISVIVVIADQLAKCLAVYKLGYLHKPFDSYWHFAAEYFTRFRAFPYRFGTDGYREPVEVIDGYLRWQLTTNTGAAFSWFRGHPEALALVSALLITLLFILYRRWGKSSRILTLAFGLQIGGAFGNFVDRVRLGEVVDFVATKIPWWADGRFGWIDFPVFNVADASAVVGTIMIGLVLLIHDIREARARARHARDETDDGKSDGIAHSASVEFETSGQGGIGLGEFQNEFAEPQAESEAEQAPEESAHEE